MFFRRAAQVAGRGFDVVDLSWELGDRRDAIIDAGDRVAFFDAVRAFPRHLKATGAGLASIVKGLDLDALLQTADRMMRRRDRALSEAQERLYRELWERAARHEPAGSQLEVEWTVEGRRGRVPAVVTALPFLDLERKRA